MSDWGPGLLDTMFVLVGVLLGVTGRASALRHDATTGGTPPPRSGCILGFIFAFGESTDKTVIGVLIVASGALTLAKGVKMGHSRRGHRRGEGGRRARGSATGCSCPPCRWLPSRSRSRPGHPSVKSRARSASVSHRSWRWRSRGS